MSIQFHSGEPSFSRCGNHPSNPAILGERDETYSAKHDQVEQSMSISSLMELTASESLDPMTPWHLLRKGTRVQLGIGAANHDPSEFPNPEQLDFTRPKINSLAFGHGPHFCLGATLARMEAQVALSRLLDRMPQVQLGTRHFEYRPLYFLRALKSLPIVVRGS